MSKGITEPVGEHLAIRDFSLSASNDIPRSRERERMSAGQVRVHGEKQFNAERVGVRCRIPRNADSFRQDLHPDLKADFILANPPFNDSDWFRKDDDVRFFSLSASNGDLRSAGSDERNSLGVKARCGPSERARASHWVGVRCRNDLPPKGNANFAWVQHFIHHLAPHGMAGFVLANGSMSSNQSGDCNARSARREWATNSQGLGSQRDIRRALIDADLADCMVALPGQLFYSTQISVCLWCCEKNNTLDSANDARLFDGETELSLVA